MFVNRFVLAAVGSLIATSAAAEIELNFYTGWQTSPHSDVTGTLPAGADFAGDFSKFIGWDGKSFAMPPYYGLRATYWTEGNTGWSLEFTHAKVYAGADMEPEFERLEFTDGHNIITVNYGKRWPQLWNNVTPYASFGLGIALPHVDITPVGGESTYGYQLTGPAARLTAGAAYPLNDSWNLFGEYQMTVSQNEVSLEGGGDLSARIITNALNFGVGYSF